MPREALIEKKAMVEGIEKVGTVEKVEKENWKPPDPWVYTAAPLSLVVVTSDSTIRSKVVRKKC